MVICAKNKKTILQKKLFFAIEMVVLSVFWQKKGLGPLGVKTRLPLKIRTRHPCKLTMGTELNKL